MTQSTALTRRIGVVRSWGAGFIGAMVLLAASATAQAEDLKFDFSSEPAKPGVIKVAPDTAYSEEQKYGFIKLPDELPGGPLNFAVNVDEGNYDVTIRFGSAAEATSTTIKAEARRLLLEKVETRKSKFETRSFTVNVRRPPIAGGGVTMINDREKGPPVSPDWDDLLTLEFNGSKPGVVSVEIKPAKDALTVFLAGDSTVTDQIHEPYTGWGQMLPRFFKPGVAVSNHAESGLALTSFERQKRLDKLLSMVKEGDYFFIQFGHNDQKDKREGAGPFTTYKDNLKKFVEAGRAKGANVVLVTPMERRRWKNDEPQSTLSDYAEAVRQVGTELKVPVIDLNAMSLKFYAALGEKASTRAFVFYKEGSLPGLAKTLSDNTHHNAYGGYELARCVVEGIKAEVPALAKFLAPDVGTFDPSKPDSPEKFDVLPSAYTPRSEKPAGS
ncbi:MAG: rhamnogalacturonan acetylesterase [Solimonas sp.]